MIVDLEKVEVRKKYLFSKTKKHKKEEYDPRYGITYVVAPPNLSGR